jgi:cysteine desulfurase
MKEKSKRLNSLRDLLEEGLREITPAARIFSRDVERAPGVTLFAAPGLDAEMAQIALDLEGFAVSRGAACASGRAEPSAALLAMGADEALARGALRVSLGAWNTEEDVRGLLAALKRLIAQGRHGAAEAAA